MVNVDRTGGTSPSIVSSVVLALEVGPYSAKRERYLMISGVGIAVEEPPCQSERSGAGLHSKSHSQRAVVHSEP